MMISNRWKGNAEVGRLDILLHPDEQIQKMLDPDPH
jgi:hypothetical protein